LVFGGGVRRQQPRVAVWLELLLGTRLQVVRARLPLQEGGFVVARQQQQVAVVRVRVAGTVGLHGMDVTGLCVVVAWLCVVVT
jgi:hypothetical protein